MTFHHRPYNCNKDLSLSGSQEKLEIKKDKKGMVYVQGSIVKSARNAKELFALFEEGSTNRHTASTSRSSVDILLFLPNFSTIAKVGVHFFLTINSCEEAVSPFIVV